MTSHLRRTAGMLVLCLVGLCAEVGGAAEPVYTVLADFEDDAVAAALKEVRGAQAGDCDVEIALVPARGQRSLVLQIGATSRDVTARYALQLRVPQRFGQPETISMYVWAEERSGDYRVTFRVLDAAGRLFETDAQPVGPRAQWVHVRASLRPDDLRPADSRVGAGEAEEAGDAGVALPLEVAGFSVYSTNQGRQKLYVDDIEVEHRAPTAEMITGSFVFDEPTRIYAPGSTIRAQVVVENRSREKRLSLSTELVWLNPDGSDLARSTATTLLPASGADYRSRRSLDFSQRIDTPGLYRLVARVRAQGWFIPREFETTIAVTPSNRAVSRGRATLFGARANLLREPRADQRLEINLARDLGVHLLAVEVPWRDIEPSHEDYDLDGLDAVVEDVTDSTMALMLVITDPPEWLVRDAGKLGEHGAQLLEVLTRRYGDRVALYQFERPVFVEGAPPAAGLLADWEAALKELRPRAQLVSPPVPVAAEEPKPGLVPAGSYVREFLTRGSVASASVALDGFARREEIEWGAQTRWLHRAAPEAGRGYLQDAEDVLRYYVRAAKAGVMGLTWCDLRDDDNDPRRDEGLCGLVRRDFSPKLAMLGYATAAGLLSGLEYAGEARGAPDVYETAVFAGGQQQVAVLLPRHNRALPAVVAPRSRAGGTLRAIGFDRRPVETIAAGRQTFVPTAETPLFIVADLAVAASGPRLVFDEPWLDVPATVFVGEDGPPAQVVITAPQPLSRSFVEVRIPEGVPIASGWSVRALRAEAGERIELPLELRAQVETDFAVTLTLRVSLEGRVVEVPFAVRPILGVRPADDAAGRVAERVELGELLLPPGALASASGTVYASTGGGGLQVDVVVSDDRWIAFREELGGERGDVLRVGVALAGQPGVYARRITWTEDSSRGETIPVAVTPLSQGGEMDAWQVRVLPAGEGRRRHVSITIPAGGLGVDELSAGQQLRLAVDYRDDDADGFAPATLSFGDGVQDGRSARSYRPAIIVQP